MRIQLVIVAGIMAVGVLSGCNNAKSPDAVANDVASAEQKAANNVADVKKDASTDISKASDVVDDKSKDLNNVMVKSDYDVAIAKAEGDHKVSLEKCNAMSGDAQKACKNKADANFEAAKANSKAAEVAHKQ